MLNLQTHLPILPIIIPFMAAALMLLFRDKDRIFKLAIACLSFTLLTVVAYVLLGFADGRLDGPWPNGVGVYLLGDWPAPFGIVVVVDRLSAIMLLLTAILGAATWVYGTARWDRAGVHFHSLFQLLIMGLNGAFLTGDLFNLFVFFEVLLAASYGLMLHGSGRSRVNASLHYIAVNLIASFLLLIALAMIYGTTGTLNMAHLAIKAGVLAGPDRLLFESAAAILGIAFLIKAAAWPLNYWLIDGYANSAPPVAGMFSIMTKVGIYALVRIGSLLEPTGAPAAFGGAWMFPAGIATLIFGAVGMLAAHQTQRMASYCIVLSSGTLLAALGMPGVILTGSALYYMLSSVFALGAFFMLLEMISRVQSFGADFLAASQEAFDLDDDDQEVHDSEEVGLAIPGPIVFLGMGFIACALLIIGLPPLSGFVAKFSLLSAALHASSATHATFNAWLFTACVLLSGFLGIVAFSRTGIRLFWSFDTLNVPRLRLIEALPVLSLIFACVVLSVRAGPITSYLEDTARYLDQPGAYINAVLQKNADRSVNQTAVPKVEDVAPTTRNSGAQP